MISAELKKRNDFLYRIKCEYSEKRNIPDYALEMRIKTARVMAKMPKVSMTEEWGE